MTPASPDEALDEAARLAREQAPALCRRDPATGYSCDWHHGLWPTLRRLGLVTAPALHGDFLKPALAGIHGENPRVLLSGASDHGLLALAIAALGGRKPQITALDICGTPLMLARWYADRTGAVVTTRRSDILAFEESDAFDAICAHAFLSYFETGQRFALAQKWHALLRPGGKVIVVNRLRPESDAQWLAFSVDQVWAYKARVEDAAQAHGLRIPGLVRAAETYANRQAIFPLRSVKELLAPFEQAGFDIEHVSVASLPPAVQQKVNAPAVPSTDAYAHLIAVRR